MSRTYKTPSPSAMHLMLLCPARALARYGPEKITEPMSPKAAEGTRLHAEARAYLDHGTSPKSAPVRAIIKHLPPAGECDRTEQNVRVRVDGITWNGSIDFEHDFRSADLKFTSSLVYVKPTEELAHDPQRIVYGLDWFDRHDENKVRAEHIYSTFDGKGSRVVGETIRRKKTLEIYREHIKPHAEFLLEHCERETDWRSKSVPKNVASCGMFPPSGCPLRRECSAVRKKQGEQKFRPSAPTKSVKVKGIK